MTHRIISSVPIVVLYIIVFSLILLIAAMIVLLIILVRQLPKSRKVMNITRLPKPPWKLNSTSKDILSEWVKVITSKNPIVWRSTDREIIWAYSTRHAAYKDIEILALNNECFLNEHMLPLAANGRITKNENIVLFERVKSLLSKEIVIMIGAGNTPSSVLPSLPDKIEGVYTYKCYLTTYKFTLRAYLKLAPSTTKYIYDVEKAVKDEKPTKQVATVFYYQWLKKRVPDGCDEILQLAMLYEPQKTICISDRRKEVYSLLHLFFTYCYIMKQSIDFIDALQLHTDKCNGSVIDRDELLYVMFVIMEWAYQSDSLTTDLVESHQEWCNSYAIMTKFMRNNPNIKLIHPDYLAELDPKIKKNILHDYFKSSPQFSTRNSGPSIDRFQRRKTKQASETKCKQKDENRTPGDDLNYWLNLKVQV